MIVLIFNGKIDRPLQGTPFLGYLSHAGKNKTHIKRIKLFIPPIQYVDLAFVRIILFSRCEGRNSCTSLQDGQERPL